MGKLQIGQPTKQPFQTTTATKKLSPTNQLTNKKYQNKKQLQ